MQKRWGLGLFLTCCMSSVSANTVEAESTTSGTPEVPAFVLEDINPQLEQILREQAEDQRQAQDEFDSWAMLEQQLMNPSLPQLAAIEMSEQPLAQIPTVSDADAAEIAATVQQAQQDAVLQNQTVDPVIVVQDATAYELNEIDQSPIQLGVLNQSLEQDGKVITAASQAQIITAGGDTTANIADVPLVEKPKHMLSRLWQRIRPNNDDMIEKIPRISADVVVVDAVQSVQVSSAKYNQAIENLKENLRGKISTFSQEAYSDFSAALPQLRGLAEQAAYAVGFYQAEFRFEQLNARQVRIYVKPNDVVGVKSQNIEFTGPEQGVQHPRFQVIKVLPDLDVGDVFHHGVYMQTKANIDNAANDNGFFDSFWRLHDVKILQPSNTADINLRFETGERYRVAKPIFQMNDPDKPLPLRQEILETLVPWQQGDDYTAWRINALANNLTNSRYFNYTLVDAIRPEPIERQLDLAPDIEALLEEYQLQRSDVYPDKNAKKTVDDQVVDGLATESNTSSLENQFVGLDDTQQNSELQRMRNLQQEKEQRRQQQQLEARKNKEVPVVVTLNADKLNTAELGAGFGTDTGPRIRGQYRRAIVNESGHSFDANMEVSEIRQAIDGRYNIPYKHPLNDYIAIVGGYEREERNDVAQGSGMLIDSAVFGGDRIIKNPRGSWQRSFGVRYRLDRLKLDGNVDINNMPPAFAGGRSEQQQSLLLGYEVSRTDSNRRVNPTRGFKQTYKVEVGSENFLTDTNLAILNARWNALYSLDAEESSKHQFVGRADLGYIFSDDFNHVPYNLRYFSGGDQSIRGFDYKSLSPEVDGYKIGGQAVATGSIEYNYQFIEGWRAAIFTDIGNAYNEDFSNPTEYGVGLGIRWESPIGPVRIDVASGISDPGKPIRVHFFIGSSL